MKKKVLIALMSLCAEGTPVLTLDICKRWITWEISPYIVAIKSTPRDLAPEFEALHVPVEYLNLTTGGFSRYYTLTKDFYRIAKRIQADAFFSMPLGWHTFMAYGVQLAGVRQVGAYIGNYPNHWDGMAFQKFKWQVQMGRPVTTTLVGCSEYVRQGAIEHFGVKPKETTTIYNGCPVEEIAERAETTRSKRTSKFTISMVARLEKHKDQPTLIEAANVLKQRGLEFVVQLVGEGSRRHEYEELIHKYQLEKYVHLLGSRRDIPELLGQTDLFVFAVKPDEGFGIALIEAMSADVPIIASDVGACREVLDDGQIGKLVPPFNPEALADAIQNAYNHPEQMEALAIKAKEKVQQEFSLDAIAKEYAQCLGLLP